MRAGAVVLLLGAMQQAAAGSVAVRASIGADVLSNVLPEYLSIDVDFWHNTTHDCAEDQGNRCWGDAGALWLDLQHPLLSSAAKALAPGFLRLGGSLDNHVKYLVGGMTLEECNAPFYAKGQTWHDLCLNMTRWDAIRQFAQDSGHRIIFGLSYQSEGEHEQWSSKNVFDFLNYTAWRRFISSFWYADALGGLALAGLEQFGRQALVGGNYGMLQMGTFEPNPDFYTAVLWKRLMGQEVLRVNISVVEEVDSASAVDQSLHVYAHCSAASLDREDETRSVTLLFVNVDETQAFSIMPASISESGVNMAGDRQEYHITAATSPPLLSKSVSLNGQPLQVTDGRLPLDRLLPKAAPSKEPIEVAPLSYGFVVLSGVTCPNGSGLRVVV